MNTPICDFVRRYADSRPARLHMPGHKGRGPLGCEKIDITEIAGADALYEADGVIKESEQNAAGLFGSAATLYSAEGSSLCVRAMVYLALMSARVKGRRPLILAARNVHSAFLYAAALLDAQVVWLWPQEQAPLCACPVSGAALESALSALPEPPAAVYLTSPDYLGGMQDIAALAACAHAHGAPLLVDNAHGAYLKFLEPSMHPLDLGADMCCDSAHKTLPVLTGGAYLHIAPSAPAEWISEAKRAMALFGSTSPSYLILQSLDLANRTLAGDYRKRLAGCVRRLDALKTHLKGMRLAIADGDPLKLTLLSSLSGLDGNALAKQLEKASVFCEYADADHVVLMFTPDNTEEDFGRLSAALDAVKPGCEHIAAPPLPRPEKVRTIREALLSPRETVSVEQALGRVLAVPAISCPPAVPVLVSGERVDRDAARALSYYGHKTVTVMKE